MLRVALVDGHKTKIQFRPQSLNGFFILNSSYVRCMRVLLFFLFVLAWFKYVFCIDKTFSTDLPI